MSRLMIGFLATLLVLLLAFPGQAQIPPGLESRISQVESAVYSLRAQVSQLEARSPGFSSGQSAPNPLPAPARPGASGDPMFDRLATLVIELKERVNRLEAQVGQLERRSP